VKLIDSMDGHPGCAPPRRWGHHRSILHKGGEENCQPVDRRGLAVWYVDSHVAIPRNSRKQPSHRPARREAESWGGAAPARAFNRASRRFRRAGKFTEALAACNVCIAQERREWIHYRLRSEVYEAMGEFAKARADYDRSMELHPMFW